MPAVSLAEKKQMAVWKSNRIFCNSHLLFAAL